MVQEIVRQSLFRAFTHSGEKEESKDYKKEEEYSLCEVNAYPIWKKNKEDKTPTNSQCNVYELKHNIVYWNNPDENLLNQEFLIPKKGGTGYTTAKNKFNNVN
jgi:hypothetical protein